LSFKPGIVLDRNEEVKVAGLAAMFASISLSCDAYFHAAVDTCRNRHLYGFVGFRNARTLASRAWRLYDPSFAPARGADPRSDDAPEDGVLNLTDLTPAIAGGARLGGRT
jgi:hypothetical protein